MTEQPEFMLMFSLGPVQSFITQARKTRDLWLGSYLLSMLMEAAMEHLRLENVKVKYPGAMLVFPTNPKIESDISDLPNKYVALFDDKDKAEQAAKESDKKIKDLWVKICNEVWNAVITLDETSEAHKIWIRQINPDSLFEIYWVIVEKKQDEKYGDWLDRTQRRFDARKRLRNFTREDEPGEKSTVSGERETLRGEGTSRADVRDFWEKLARKKLSNGKRLSAKDISQDGSERLDAVDTVKRFAIYSPTVEKELQNRAFPSTSSVATAPFIENLLTKPINAADLETWHDKTIGELADLQPDAIKAIPLLEQIAHTAYQGERIWILRRDGDLYFPETFVPHRLEKDYGIIGQSEAEGVIVNTGNALRTLLTATDALSIPRPTPYYALVQMDGDKMGTLLSNVQNLAEHKGISEALSEFSRTSAPEIVEKQYLGRLVYAGGDDVFALAPLARDVDQGNPDAVFSLLDLVDRLQQLYCEKVRAAVFDQKQKEKVSASTGIAIAHHYTSLSYIRRRTKEAEEIAKEQYGRNALVMTVIRRSGEQTRVGCRWHYEGLDGKGQPIPLFLRFYQLFNNDYLSPKCVHILLEEAPTLVWLAPETQESEVKRVLLRQKIKQRDGEQFVSANIGNSQEDKPPSDEEIGKLAEYIQKLATKMNEDHLPLINPETNERESRAVDLHSEKIRHGLVEVLGWLLAMAFLARKEGE
ncbi:MAG: type III-B CRISPR-associated protein Cas10/Cmr2 [Ktedonobacteraceae bacterium]